VIFSNGNVAGILRILATLEHHSTLQKTEATEFLCDSIKGRRAYLLSTWHWHVELGTSKTYTKVSRNIRSTRETIQTDTEYREFKATREIIWTNRIVIDQGNITGWKKNKERHFKAKMEVQTAGKKDRNIQTKEITLTANNDYESSKWIRQSPTKQVLLITNYHKWKNFKFLRKRQRTHQ
jgi:hypothetical protein